MKLVSTERRKEHRTQRKLAVAIAAATALLWQSAIAETLTTGSDIDQGGTDNTALITQDNLSEGMYAHIIQTGAGQDASIYQSGPVEDFLVAEIEQAGSDNVATTEQTGVIYEGTLTISQDGRDNSATGTQTGGYQTEGSIAQVGDLNQATLLQADTYSIAAIRQEGTSNLVAIEQNGIDAYFQKANVEQIGANNTMHILQERMGENWITAKQMGTGNYAELHQWQAPDISYGEAEINMLVDGDNNSVYVLQDVNPSGEFALNLQGDENRVDVSHGGEVANTRIVSQNSNYNSDVINQNGLGAVIDINRYNTNNSRTNIEQASFNETITIEQVNSDNVSVDILQVSMMSAEIHVKQLYSQNVNALVEQGTALSTATVEQADTTNSRAYIRQDYSAGAGGNLIASIYQTHGADMATAEIHQSNMNNTALIEQAGVSGTDATIVQTGVGGYATIVQTGADGGASNSATITQGGENHSASIYQDGSNNVATIAQM